MLATQTSRHSIAVTRIAEAHARQTFLYYFLRALLEAPGGVADSERRVVHAAAVEARRQGFRLESNAEGVGLRLGDYDEENFRRETYRAANLSLTDPAAAREFEEGLIEQTVDFALHNAVAADEAEELRTAA
jgi:hypothetical protein